MLGNERALWLLFAVPVVLLPVYVWSFWRKARGLRILADSEMLKNINNTVSLRKQIFKAFLLVAAFVAIVAALTEPNMDKGFGEKRLFMEPRMTHEYSSITVSLRF